MVVKPITYFGQIKLTKIDKLELSLKDLVAYLQAESSRELAKAKEKIKSLMSVSIEIEPLVNLSDKKILLQITCLNESLARDLRMALFRLANKANTDSCIRFRNVKDVAGGYHTNMFVLAAKSSLDLENTLKLWDQSTASSSCSLEP